MLFTRDKIMAIILLITILLISLLLASYTEGLETFDDPLPTWDPSGNIPAPLTPKPSKPIPSTPMTSTPMPSTPKPKPWSLPSLSSLFNNPLTNALQPKPNAAPK